MQSRTQRHDSNPSRGHDSDSEYVVSMQDGPEAAHSVKWRHWFAGYGLSESPVGSRPGVSCKPRAANRQAVED